MANWLSVKSAAEKYGITEERICEMMRLRHISYSPIDRDQDNYLESLVDTDEIDNAFKLNTIEALPDDGTVERVPTKLMNWLYGECERLERNNDKLREEINSYYSKDISIEKDLERLSLLVDKLKILIPDITDNTESKPCKKRVSLCRFFKGRK